MNSNDIARPRAFAIALADSSPMAPSGACQTLDAAATPPRRHRRRRAAFILFIHRGYHG